MTIAPVQNGDQVEVSGRLFTDETGRLFVRPRLNPLEPNLPEAQQNALDSTESKVQIFNGQEISQSLDVSNRWATLVGSFHDGAIDLISAAPGHSNPGDTWTSHPSIEEDGDTPKQWLISKEREEHLKSVLDVVTDHTEEWKVISFGLNGTQAGSFSATLNVLWVTDGLAEWADGLEPDDLLPRSFVRRVAATK